MIVVAIDASNLRAGGGLTHLAELLRAAEPEKSGVGRVKVWAGAATLEVLPDRAWLERRYEPALDRSAAHRFYWRWSKLRRLARGDAAVLFVPGGSYTGGFHPFVTMCRNMLPFERRERARFGLSRTRLRLELLRRIQAASFRRADGLIFLTEYAARRVRSEVGTLAPRSAIIPHGVADAFRAAPRTQRPRASYTEANPFRFLYVSIVELYKFQWTVAEAAALLRSRGVPVAVDFVGPSSPAAMRKLRRAMARHDPAGDFLRYAGPLRGRELVARYHAADAFVFASSCENMPNILLEAMAAGLPITSSSRGPMPEILGDSGVYFDPEDPMSIAAAMEQIVDDDALRARLAAGAYEHAAAFSWRSCARQTFDFLAEVARGSGAS